MKTRGLILLFLFLFSKTEADSYNKIEIRNAFVLACIDEDKNDALIERLQNIQGNDPLIAAHVVHQPDKSFVQAGYLLLQESFGFGDNDTGHPSILAEIRPAKPQPRKLRR